MRVIVIRQNRRYEELGCKTSEINPALKQVAYIRLAVIRAYRSELSKIAKPGMKGQIMREFLQLFNSGLLLPEEFKKPAHVSRATLYAWDRAYKINGLRALIPQYKGKQKKGVNVVPIKLIQTFTRITIPGPPRTRGRKEFLRHLRRQWQRPPLDCAITLIIFFSMPVPKGTSMRKRMMMLKDKISHVKKPHLDTLTAFSMDCMEGIVYKDYSQIIRFNSEKRFRWFPQTQIFIRGLIDKERR